MPVDGDARPDVVAFARSNQQLVLHLNTSDSEATEFDAAVVIDASVASGAFDGPGLASVDADGALDLVVSMGELTLYLNEGGTSQRRQRRYRQFGLSDLHCRPRSRRRRRPRRRAGYVAVWYENLGNGGFGPQRSMAEGSFSSSLVVGDGDTDVVLRETMTDDVVWIENGSNGLVLRTRLGTAFGALRGTLLSRQRRSGGLRGLRLV